MSPEERKKERKKERVFYLDFIRAISTIMIVLSHYNALYFFNSSNPSAMIGDLFVANVNMGGLGVSLFLILSGASLYITYGYREKINWKEFYYKRITTLLPIYWISFLVIFLYDFYKNGYISNIPIKNLLFTFIGMDGYALSFGFQTFFVVGEWFLGFIILIYLIFPFLIYFMKHHTKLLFLLITCSYIATLLFYKGTMNIQMLPTTRLIEIVFGMALIKSQKNISKFVAFISLIIIILNKVYFPPIPQILQIQIVGISTFLVLAFIGSHLNFGIIKRICAVLCKYSYPCFIIHHTIIYRLSAKFDLSSMTPLNSYLLFFCCCLVIMVASWLLYHITESIKSVILESKD